MEKIKVFLFTIGFMLSMHAGAVEFGQYRPAETPGPIFRSFSSNLQSNTTRPATLEFGSVGVYTSHSDYSSNGAPKSNGPRRAPAGDGRYDGDAQQDSGGVWFIWDEEEGWRLVAEGDTWNDGGVVKIFTGGVWVNQSHQIDPNQPIGTLPVLLMLLLCAVYIAVKKRKQSNLA